MGLQRGLAVALVALAAMIAACSTLPDRIESLERARAAVDSASALPNVQQVAPSEIRRAQTALDRASAMAADNEDLDLIEHEAYIATRYAETASALVAANDAEARIGSLEDLREQIVLENSKRQAAAAQMRAASAQQRASTLEMRAASAEQRASELAEALESMQAKETERGVVLTLGDVLFETDKAQLKPGAATSLDRLAQFMVDYPERRVLIEGHTDSRGSDQYNQRLSRDRADTVRDALVLRGIDPTRIVTVGRGEAYPVATNETVAGRQQNRRVDIVISDADGRIAAGGVAEPAD
ncbi:MAG TPA: OmpA family protein [Steroidobacteraceae bacterium]|nr:OmpA family protein [Steroidobacteraceae bacterium]